MTKTRKILLIVFAVVVVGMLIYAAVSGSIPNTEPETEHNCVITDCEECNPTTYPVTTLNGTFWSLFPPIVAIGLALITKEVYSSLFVGVLTGALLYTDFSFAGTMDTLSRAGM